MMKFCRGLLFTTAMLMAVPAQANMFTTGDVAPDDLFFQGSVLLTLRYDGLVTLTVLKDRMLLFGQAVEHIIALVVADTRMIK